MNGVERFKSLLNGLESGTSLALKVRSSSGSCGHGTWNLTQELESLKRDEFGVDAFGFTAFFSAADLCYLQASL